MNIKDLVRGRLYRMKAGDFVEFSRIGGTGWAIFHPPGEPDMQSCFAVDPEKFESVVDREATTDESLSQILDVSIPAPPVGSAPGYYLQQLELQRNTSHYCDKVLSALERTCDKAEIDSVAVKEAILRLFALSAPMTAKDAETELLLRLVDYFKVEMEKDE